MLLYYIGSIALHLSIVKPYYQPYCHIFSRPKNVHGFLTLGTSVN